MDTSERRLELVRSVREEQARNQQAMRHREAIMYGTNNGTYYDTYQNPQPSGTNTPESGSYAGFKLRFIITLILIALFWLGSKNEWEIGGYNSTRIAETICESTNSIDFTTLFPYTLEE